MSGDESDNFEHLYEEGDDSKHDKLVEKVLLLNKNQQLKKATRTEPTLQISEFNLVKSITGPKGSVEVNDLTKALKNKKSGIKIGKDVGKLKKGTQTLPKPLERPQANRIRRTVAYEKTRLELDRWEPVITSNRISTNLSFPLDNDTKVDRAAEKDFTSMWRLKSKLEIELEKIEPKVEEYHVNLVQEKFPLTMNEMLARRKEAAKLRAFQGYKEAKARRQNKIKSKKYHRIQKRARIKQQLKEFEILQKTDPEAAVKKLDEIEKCRAEERFSLRHKSTGKWAKNQQIRAKYDKESRQVLAQQLSLSRELTQKLKSNENDSDEEPVGDVTDSVPGKIDLNNPWVNGITPDKEVADFVSGYKKYWVEKNSTEPNELHEDKIEETHQSNQKQNISSANPTSEDDKIKDKGKQSKKLRKKNEFKKLYDGNKKNKKRTKSSKIERYLNGSTATSDWEVTTLNDESNVIEMFEKLENKIHKNKLKTVKKLKSKLKGEQLKDGSLKKKSVVCKKNDLDLPLQSKKPIIDDELTENSGQVNDQVNASENLEALKTILQSNTKEGEASNIDPNKYLKVKQTSLSTAIPDILTTDENEEEVIDQRDLITEAFEDDDIVDEFNKEKRKDMVNDHPKSINLALPGWGCWGGHDVKISKRKKRRFIIKPPPKMRRRDDNKGSLIINESAQSKVKEHMVSEVPFPFKTVKDFEASMRAPIGNTFVAETAFRKLTKPAMTTKLGAIIEPISKDVLLNKSG